MPELPEVETVVRSLRPYVVSKKIVHIDVRKDKSFPDSKRFGDVIDHKITKVWRRAKLIIMDLDNHYHLLTHLKMTGQLLYQSEKWLAGGGHPTRDVLAQLPGKHTRVILDLDDGSHLFFNDLRIFGWIRVLNDDELALELAKYGPDANAIADPDRLWSLWQRVRRPIKQVLMDNKYLSGIGNIYAAELCWECGLDPRRPAFELSRDEVKALARQAHDLLERAISYGGTTFDGRYVNADGKGGEFEQFLDVYGRGGQKCHRCGAMLKSIKIGGRSSVFCEPPNMGR